MGEAGGTSLGGSICSAASSPPTFGCEYGGVVVEELMDLTVCSKSEYKDNRHTFYELGYNPHSKTSVQICVACDMWKLTNGEKVKWIEWE